jgi:TPR repeat protein
MRELLISFVVFVLVLLTSAAIADNYDDALQAANVGDYKKAYQLWLIDAEKGSAVAQRNIGLMYDEGLGVPQNGKKAVKWYRMAAEQGEKLAQYYLGTMLEEGRGVPLDYKEAVKWYRLAAGQGHVKAQYKLGLMYLKGQGVLQNSEIAYAWWSVAASKGHEEARKYKQSAQEQMTAEQIEKAQQIAKQIWQELGN